MASVAKCRNVQRLAAAMRIVRPARRISAPVSVANAAKPRSVRRLAAAMRIVRPARRISAPV
jgi:hypothetical protein